MTWHTTRKAPYTEAGIRRLKCVRCDKKASFQWQICADGNNYRPLCLKCDVALNRMVLKWMKHPQSDSQADYYAMTKTG